MRARLDAVEARLEKIETADESGVDASDAEAKCGVLASFAVPRAVDDDDAAAPVTGGNEKRALPSEAEQNQALDELLADIFVESDDGTVVEYDFGDEDVPAGVPLEDTEVGVDAEDDVLNTIDFGSLDDVAAPAPAPGPAPIGGNEPAPAPVGDNKPAPAPVSAPLPYDEPATVPEVEMALTAGAVASLSRLALVAAAFVAARF